MVRTRTPFGIGTALGAALIIVACLVAAVVPAQDQQGRLAIVAVVVAGFAAIVADPVTALVVAWAAFLLLDGFLVDRLGDLAWHGPADVVRLLALTVAALLGSGVGRARLWLRRERAFAPVVAWANTAGLAASGGYPDRRPGDPSRPGAGESLQLSSRKEGRN